MNAKQLLELERIRQQTMQNGNKLLQMEAKSEGELRMQQQQLIKAQQSLRVTNAEENALREKLIAKINANKEALKGMSDEVSKQRDNVGNYKSVWDAFTQGQIQLRPAMKLVRDEMSALEGQMASGNKLTAEQQKRYNDLNIAMGNLTDIQGDMSARAKILSDDYRQMTFALEGVKLGVNVMTSLQSVTALLGDDNEELQKAMAKVVATQQILNTVGEIQKQLNKDSSIMVNLRIIKEKLLTKEIEGQTRAQMLLNKAKLGMVGVAIAVVGALGTLIYKYAKAKSEVADFTKEINKQATDAVAPTIAKVEVLKAKWDALGGSLEKQKKFLTDNKTELEGIGVALTNVSEAEKFFSEQTPDFIKAQLLRAQAEASRSKIEELAKKRLDARLEYERKYVQNQKTLWEDVEDYSLKIQTHGADIMQARKEAYKQQQEQFDQEMKSLIMLSGTLDEQSKAILDNLNLKEKDKDATKEQTQATKDLTDALAGEDEASLLWALRELNKIYAETDKAFEEYIKWGERKKEITSENIEIEEEEAEKVETLTELRKRLAKEEEEMLKKRKDAIQDAKENLTEAFEAITQSQLDNLERQSEAYDENYERRKQAIENTVMSEEEKDRRLKALDNEKTAHDRQIARQRAEIERRQAIFQNAIASAEAMSKAVASVGELLSSSAKGDPYTAVARYIAAIAAGVTAVTTISSLISQLIKIPAFEKGGTAQANKPFIAGEKGREIGFGVYSGKVYDFSKPMIYQAPEPVQVKNARETRQIINNNEYNKDVTLHNEVVVQVIDNKRIDKFFKIW